MRNAWKRSLALLMTLVMLLCMLPAAASAEGDGGEAPAVSRADWVAALVEVFGMTVEADNYPDNYYSDIDAEDAFYRDIMVAVEFGVIDLEAGEPFCPNDAATRDFAAATLVYCLGFQPEEEQSYTFTDTVPHPFEAQLAVDRGWFALVGGEFLPEQAITEDETHAMLADAAEIWASQQIDESHDNTAQFADGVIVFPMGTTIENDEDAILIYDTSISLKAGDIFVIYYGDLPITLLAETVELEEDHYRVEGTTEGTEDAVEDIDYEGVVPADLVNFQPSPATSYIREDGLQVQSSATRFQVYNANGPVSQRSIGFDKTVSIGGLSAHIIASLSNITLDTRINQKQQDYSIVLNGTTYQHTSVSGSLTGIGASGTLEIGSIPFLYGVGNLSLVYEYDMSGSLSLSWEGTLCVGVAYTKGTGFRLIRSYTRTSFSVLADVTGKLGMKASASVDIQVLRASLWGSIGGVVRVKAAYYENETPETCRDQTGWMYAKAGVYASVPHVKSYSKTIDIYTAKNSPIRVHYHWEDGQLVNDCTRKAAFKAKTGIDPGNYYTDPGSYYFNPCVRDATSSYTGSSGETIVVWTYTLDEENHATITGYNGSAGTILVPATIDGYTVTAIGSNAFKNKTTLRTVTVSDTIVTVGNSAFDGCTNLVIIDLPDSVTDIGHYAFARSGLTSLILPKHVESLGYGILLGNTGVKELTIPKTVNSVGLANINIRAEIINDFYSGYQDIGVLTMSGVEKLTFEQGTTAILIRIAQKAPYLKEVVIPDTVTRIIDNAFESCLALETINIPNSVTKIGEGAFSRCSALTAIDLPDSVTDIGHYAFARSGLTSLILPKHVESLGYGILLGNTGVKELTIPKTVNSVGLANINIRAEIINDFYSGYQDIGVLTMSGVEKLTFEQGTTAILIRIAQKAPYLKEVVIPDTVTRIIDNAFESCLALETINIPNSVTKIGEGAFSRCSALTAIDLPDSVTDINTGAFANSGLTTVIVPDSVTGMGEGVFQNCTALTSVKLPASRVNIMKNTFYGCSSLLKIELPETVENIREGAFQNCTSLSEIVWSEAPKLIDANAFRNCTALASITIPDSVTSLGSAAFYNCDALTKLEIPDSVTSIGNQLCYDCDALTEVKLGKGLTAIPASAFEHCDVLESIVLPYRVSSIGSKAFKDCLVFKSITIPRATTTIASDAFSYYDKLTIYGVPGTYAETYANEKGIAFVGREVNATAVTLSETTLTLYKGQSAKLQFAVTPADFTDAVSWKSGSTSVATVADDGTVKAVAVGTATIKLIVGSVSASCKVTVVQPVTGISLNRTSLTLQALDTFQLTATVNPSDAYNKEIVWSSDNESVAAVDQTGLVTALKKGTATITAAAQDGSGNTATCMVTVSNSATICRSVDELESPHNYPNNCSDFWVYTHAGAEELAVTFDERTEIEDGFDYLRIFDGTGSQVGEYTGTELAGQTVTVPGDTVRIQLVSDDSGSEWGFKVSAVRVAGAETLTLPAELTAIESEAFADLERAVNVKVPEGVTSIAEDAFRGSDVTIVAKAGSYAIAWAQEHGVPFVIDEG